MMKSSIRPFVACKTRIDVTVQSLDRIFLWVVCLDYRSKLLDVIDIRLEMWHSGQKFGSFGILNPLLCNVVKTRCARTSNLDVRIVKIGRETKLEQNLNGYIAEWTPNWTITINFGMKCILADIIGYDKFGFGIFGCKT
jgi:hypothetical protein